jgi:hypothetical protein
MTDPRDDFRPYWPSTVAPFDTASEPPSVPARAPWQHPLLPQLLAAVLDSSKVPIPPARPPWFPGMAMNIPSIGKTPAWMESAVPPDEGRGILGQFSGPTQPAPNGWDPSDPSRWHRPAVANVESPVPAAPPIYEDPFMRAAHRTRQSVQPPFGRQPGFTTALLQNLVPAAVQGMATLPPRAIEAAGNLQRTGEYDPGPAFETAMLMVGTPLTPAGALGSSARRPPRLPMDEASRMARADGMGFKRNMPVEYGTAPASEKIATPAIDVNGRIFEGRAHLDALETAERELGVPYSQMQYGPFVDGYVTNAGRYVSRWEGGDIARRADQARKTALFGRELASEDVAKMSSIKPSSKVYTGATAPGLPGGEGPWGWVVPDGAASALPSPSGRRMQRPSASEMAASATQASREAAIPPGPIWHRSERSMSIDARGAAEGEIQASLKKAWDQGYDAVMVKNYTSRDGRTGTVLVVKDLAQLRSPNARFNPAKRDSSDLLAGLAGAGILSPFLRGSESQ